MWIGTKSRHMQLKTKRFDLDQKTRKFATCPLLPDPRTHLRQRQGATGDTWSGNIAPRMADGSSSRGPHPARPGYMCCRACTAESTAPRSTVHLKRIPEGPCAKARRRHGAHRRHGALGARRPSSAALRVNDPRTVSKVVCPRPPRTPRCCSAVPVAVEVSTACVYRWQEQQPGKTWEGQCPSTGRRTLGFSAH